MVRLANHMPFMISSSPRAIAASFQDVAKRPMFHFDRNPSGVARATLGGPSEKNYGD